MNRRMRGFTVVELLIVIIVMGILAGISVTVWVQATSGARDLSRETDTRAWAGSFNLYKSRFGIYPALPTADGLPGIYACLGTFTTTGSKCVQYSGAAAQYVDATVSPTTTMLTEIAKVGNVPTDSGPPIRSKLNGPVLWETQVTNAGVVTVTANFINFFETKCPSDFSDITASADPLFSGVSAYAKICSLVKTFAYTPS